MHQRWYGPPERLGLPILLVMEKYHLSVLPSFVEYNLTVHGGRISLKYDLFVDDNYVNTNVLLLNIKEEVNE